MTNITNYLVKITDYPFSYSFVGLVLADKFNLNNELFLLQFIFVVGLLGTTLSIIDPIGKGLKFIVKIFLNRSLSGNAVFIEMYAKTQTETEAELQRQEEARAKHAEEGFELKEARALVTALAQNAKKEAERVADLETKAIEAEKAEADIEKSIQDRLKLKSEAYVKAKLFKEPIPILGKEAEKVDDEELDKMAKERFDAKSKTKAAKARATQARAIAADLEAKAIEEKTILETKEAKYDKLDVFFSEEVPKREKSAKRNLDSFIGKTLSTSWITYEVDKIVSTMYFLIILVSILVLIHYHDTKVLENFMIFLNSTSPEKDFSYNNTKILENFMIFLNSTSPEKDFSYNNTKILENFMIFLNSTSPEKDSYDSINMYIQIVSIILFIAILIMSIIIVNEFKKLYKNSVVVFTYLFSNEIVPELVSSNFRMKKINKSDENIGLSSDISERIQELKDKSKILYDTIEKKDWGLAQVYASPLNIRAFHILTDEFKNSFYVTNFTRSQK